jgi:hypothetical protein
VLDFSHGDVILPLHVLGSLVLGEAFPRMILLLPWLSLPPHGLSMIFSGGV